MPSPSNDKAALSININQPSADSLHDTDRPHDSNQPSTAALPARPPLRSNFELEPNPFEQSFSVSSSSSLSSLRNRRGANGGPSPPSPGKKSPSAASSSTQDGQSHARKLSMNGSSHPNGDTPKPVLPPLASITSPSDPSYAWAFSSAGLTNSLRAGPLSPAMLAGPQTQKPVTSSQPASSIAALAASAGSMHPPLFGFDPSGSFRTGLTPSTGLTPLVGGPVAFPPPSPNTAAFLAMVNSGAAGNAAAATITPNTLSALTSVLQQSASSTSQTGQQANGSNTVSNGRNSSPSSGTAQSQSVAPSQMSASASSNYQTSPLASQRYALSSILHLFKGAQFDLTDSNNSTSNSNNTNVYSDATGAANHAANGLFLLSQAHQELTKREEAQKQSLAQSSTAAGARGSTAQNQPAQSTANGTSTAKRGSKRKTDSVSVSSSTSSKTGPSKKSKTSPVSTRGSAARRASTVVSQDGDEDGDDDDDSGDEQLLDQLPPQSAGGNKSKKPETEEEKRRNFLERNRQAALKCRQRKKQWLAQMQAKNEFLQNENERLTAALVSSREEIARLSQLVGGAGVGLSSGVVPMVGVAGIGVQQQQVHHAPYLAHQQQQHHHPIAVPVSLPQGSSSIHATAASPSMTTRSSPHNQQHHPNQQVQHSPNPHSPTSDGRSSRSSLRDPRDYANGAASAVRESSTREYAREMRDREMNHMHGHAPQAVAVNGRGYGY